jgi:hypothetical protein
MTMGKYLDILRQPHPGYDQYDINDKRYTNACSEPGGHNQPDTFGRLCRFCRTLDDLERRCPAYVDAADWLWAIEDGRRFLSRWGERAEALDWTSSDLFGLHNPLEKPAPSYRQRSRYDQTGLIWLLHGQPVIALTATEAVIRAARGATLTYRRYKPAREPLDNNINAPEAAR